MKVGALALAWSLLLAGSVFGARALENLSLEDGDATFATIDGASGVVQRRSVDLAIWDYARVGQGLGTGNLVATAKAASARIVFASGFALDLDESTQILVADATTGEAGSGPVVTILRGRVVAASAPEPEAGGASAATARKPGAQGGGVTLAAGKVRTHLGASGARAELSIAPGPGTVSIRALAGAVKTETQGKMAAVAVGQKYELRIETPRATKLAAIEPKLVSLKSLPKLEAPVESRRGAVAVDAASTRAMGSTLFAKKLPAQPRAAAKAPPQAALDAGAPLPSVSTPAQEKKPEPAPEAEPSPRLAGAPVPALVAAGSVASATDVPASAPEESLPPAPTASAEAPAAAPVEQFPAPPPFVPTPAVEEATDTDVPEPYVEPLATRFVRVFSEPNAAAVDWFRVDLALGMPAIDDPLLRKISFQRARFEGRASASWSLRVEATRWPEARDAFNEGELRFSADNVALGARFSQDFELFALRLEAGLALARAGLTGQLTSVDAGQVEERVVRERRLYGLQPDLTLMIGPSWLYGRMEAEAFQALPSASRLRSRRYRVMANVGTGFRVTDHGPYLSLGPFFESQRFRFTDPVADARYVKSYTLDLIFYGARLVLTW